MKKDQQRQGTPLIDMFHVGKKGKVWKIAPLKWWFWKHSEVSNMLVYIEKKVFFGTQILDFS